MYLCINVFMYSCINEHFYLEEMVSFVNILVISYAHIYNKISIPVIATYLLH